MAPKVLARNWWNSRYLIDVAAQGSSPGPIRGLNALAKAIDAAGKFVPSAAMSAALDRGALTAQERAQLEAAQRANAERALVDGLQEQNAIVWLTREVKKPTGESTGFGPFSRERVKVSVEVLGTKVATVQEFEVAHRYLLNVSVMAVFGPTKVKYKVSNGTIAKSDDQIPVDLFAGLQFYPFRRNPCEGRFFDKKLQSWNDRFGVIAGTSVTSFGDAAYLGLSYEVFTGVQASFGWQPRREQELKSGFNVGDAIAGSEAPTDKKWSLSNWGAALSVDTDLIRSVTQ